MIGILVGALLVLGGLPTMDPESVRDALTSLPPPASSAVIAAVYTSLPEYWLWAVGVMIQLAVFVSVLAFLWLGPRETELSRLPALEAVAVAVLTASVIVLPEVLGSRDIELPLPHHRARLGVVVGTGLVAILVLTNRLARIHRAFLAPELDAARHAALRRETRDLLTIAAVVVTLATLGSALLHQSLQALETALAQYGYTAPMAQSHVVAYGAYSTLLLAVFFAPVIVADRRGALTVREAAGGRGEHADLDAHLGLDVGLVERIGSALGVLAPLLGALAAQLLP